MPQYRCNTPVGALSQEQRNEIAKAFTDAHASVTGAPRNFVSVLFFETPEGADSGYPTPYFIDGGNRAGRSPETKQAIMDRLTRALSEIGGIPRDSIAAKISDAPASWSMSGGRVAPEPGEEGAEWYAEKAVS